MPTCQHCAMFYASVNFCVRDTLELKSATIPLQKWHWTFFLFFWAFMNELTPKIPICFSDDSIINGIHRRWMIATERVKVNACEKEKFLASLDELFNILRCECDFVTCADAKPNVLKKTASESTLIAIVQMHLRSPS